MEKTWDEFFEEWEKGFEPVISRELMATRVLLQAQDMKATHVALYRNQTLDSPELGHCSILLIGPELTVKTVDNIGEVCPRVGDTPSRFKYFVCYAKIKEE